MYNHECIGVVTQPEIPLYLLKEDAFDSFTFHAKAGDLLLGGGQGERATLRIAIPEAIYWFTQENFDDMLNHLPDGKRWDRVVKAYWRMNDAYAFGEVYSELGWSLDEIIEFWLAEHVVAFILREYPEQFGKWRGNEPLSQDGSIFRLPTPQEKSFW